MPDPMLPGHLGAPHGRPLSDHRCEADRRRDQRVVIGGATTLPNEAARGELKVEPDIGPLEAFLSMLDTFDM